MNQTSSATATVGLLIRMPIADVFAVFVDAQKITKIWFNRSSGSLQQGATVTWYWDEFNASTEVNVLSMRENERILIEWDAQTASPSIVEWTFESRSNDSTYVNIVHSGFDPQDSNLTAKVADSTGGFAFLLAAAKAYLEFGKQLNIVADRF